jgi:hypothetical protein
MGRRARHARRGRGPTGVPAALAPLLGAAVLVGAVRGLEQAWLRVRGVRPAQEESLAARLVHATLLTQALRLAGRFGLPKGSGRRS